MFSTISAIYVLLAALLYTFFASAPPHTTCKFSFQDRSPYPSPPPFDRTSEHVEVHNYNYTKTYIILPNNERGTFFALSRPGPPPPVVIYDPYPTLNNTPNKERAMVEFVEKNYLSKGMNFFVLNAFHLPSSPESESSSYFLSPFNDNFKFIVLYLHSHYSKQTPVAIIAHSFRGGRALEHTTGSFWRDNVVAIYTVNPVLTGVSFFRDLSLSFHDKLQLFGYSLYSTITSIFKIQKSFTFEVTIGDTAETIEIAADELFTQVLLGYSFRFLTHINSEAFVRMVLPESTLSAYLQKNDKIAEKNLGIHRQISSDAEIFDLFKAMFSKFDDTKSNPLNDMNLGNQDKMKGKFLDLDKDFGPSRKSWFL